MERSSKAITKILIAAYLCELLSFSISRILNGNFFHRMDFILTWNFKHIANSSIRSKLEVLANSKEMKLPVISTPEELLF